MKILQGVRSFKKNQVSSVGTVCLGTGGNLSAITSLMLYSKVLKQPSFISSDLRIG